MSASKRSTRWPKFRSTRSVPSLSRQLARRSLIRGESSLHPTLPPTGGWGAWRRHFVGFTQIGEPVDGADQHCPADHVAEGDRQQVAGEKALPGQIGKVVTR